MHIPQILSHATSPPRSPLGSFTVLDDDSNIANSFRPVNTDDGDVMFVQRTNLFRYVMDVDGYGLTRVPGPAVDRPAPEEKFVGVEMDERFFSTCL